MDLKSQATLLKKSKHIHKNWYLKSYPDVAILGMDPAIHYIIYGAKMGRNPGKNFDTSFYVGKYPDVREAGINPLLHYVLYGKREGRRPRRGKVEVMFHNLWGGHSQNALEELKLIIEDESQNAYERYEAAWQSARWYSFVDNNLRALELAELMAKLIPSKKLDKARVLLHSVCLQRLGKSKKTRTILKKFLDANPSDSDAKFFLMNGYVTDDKTRIKILNSIYESNGFLGLKLLDKKEGLSLKNIAGKKPGYTADSSKSAKVSIIMPAYYAGDRINIAIDSLLKQTWNNLEIIVVDDCSPDDTYQVAVAYEQKDRRVKAVRAKQNGGAYAARNIGLRYATGDYITTHDSDDWSHPQKIETQVKALNSDSLLKGVIAHWIRCHQDFSFTQNWRPSDHLIHWSHSSFMFRRAVYKELGCWDEVRIGADTEYIWRVEHVFGKNAIKKICPKVPLALALDDEGSLTRAKATHVKTVYFGLRHIYREICAWKHRVSLDLYLEDNSSSVRSVDIPKGMLKKSRDTQEFDFVIVSDFSSNSLENSLGEICEQLHEKGFRLALFHWPMFNEKQYRLHDKYFELIAGKKATPIVFGDQVKTKYYIASSAHLLSYQLDAYPDFEAEESGIIFSNSNLSED